MPANCVSINIQLFSIVDLKMANTAVKQLTAAYESVGQYSKCGLHPEEFLMIFSINTLFCCNPGCSGLIGTGYRV